MRPGSQGAHHTDASKQTIDELDVEADGVREEEG